MFLIMPFTLTEMIAYFNNKGEGGPSLGHVGLFILAGSGYYLIWLCY